MNIPLPQNNYIRVVGAISLVALGLYFLPFTIGGLLAYIVFRQISAMEVPETKKRTRAIRN